MVVEQEAQGPVGYDEGFTLAAWAWYPGRGW